MPAPTAAPPISTNACRHTYHPNDSTVRLYALEQVDSCAAADPVARQRPCEVRKDDGLALTGRTWIWLGGSGFCRQLPCDAVVVRMVVVVIATIVAVVVVVVRVALQCDNNTMR